MLTSFRQIQVSASRKCIPLSGRWLAFASRTYAIGIIVCWLIPGYLLMRSDYALGYDYIQNIRVAASANSPALLPAQISGLSSPTEHQGGEVIKLLMIRATGIPVEDLLIFPLGALLVPLAFFLLCRECLDWRLAALLSLSVAFDPTVSFSSYHTTIYTWSRPLFLMVFWLFLKLLKNKSPELVFLAFMTFVSLFLVYWTEPSLIVIFAICLNVLIVLVWMVLEQRRTPIPRSLSPSIALAFLVINLGLGEFIYGILPRIFGQNTGSQFGTAIYSLYQRVLIMLGILKPTIEVFSTYGESSPILTIQVFRYGLILLPILWLGIADLRRVGRKEHPLSGQHSELLVLWAIVGMLVFHTLLYSSYGHASTRYLALVGPFVGVLAADRINLPRLGKWTLASLLSLLAIISFFLEYPQTRQHSNWEDIRPPVAWLMQNSDTKMVLTNVGMFGMSAMATAETGVFLKFECYTDESYQAVLGQADPKTEQIDQRVYVVIDRQETNQEMCPGFKFFEPLSRFIPLVESNPTLNAVYDNGSIWILHPVGEDRRLPISAAGVAGDPKRESQPSP
jgi:hypothetical protein